MEPYSGEALKEIAPQPIAYAGQNACETCHPAIGETKSKGVHAWVNCESCHGPQAKHAEDPGTVKPQLPDVTTLCVRCHSENIAKPSGFPQKLRGPFLHQGKLALRYEVSTLQVLLDEAWTEVHVNLYQRRVTNHLETMHLTSLDYKNISRAALEGLAVDGPQPSSFTDELDFIIGMPVRSGSGTGLPVEQEDRDTGVTLISSNKLMRTANKRQTLLAHVIHPFVLLPMLDECGYDPVLWSPLSSWLYSKRETV